MNISNHNPLKILYVITGLSTGGAETMLYKLLQNINRSQFKPFVISLTNLGEFGPRIESLGVPVVALEMKFSTLLPIKFFKLFILIRRFGPSLVHTWMYHADLIGGIASRLAGVKALSWGIRHSDLTPGKDKRSTLLVMRICALMSSWLPRRILTCSKRAQEIHVSAGYCPAKMYLIPNGFDLTRYKHDPNANDSVCIELGLPCGTQLVSLIARDNPQKNHAGFLEAASYVHATRPDVHFVLAGTGIDQNNHRLKSLIERLGLQKNVHLLGRRDDIPRLMSSCILVSSSSFGEAFPNVLGEAMACEVPCVVTDVGDSAEIVGDLGKVVDAGDMLGLARNIVEIIDMKSEERTELGRVGRERVLEHYEISDITRRYENFYGSLLEST